jgi:ABC-type transport system involved in cytochrome c biogenesis permease subunit
MLAALRDLTLHRDDPARAEAAAVALRAASRDLADARGEYGKIPLEVSLHRLAPFHRAMGFYIVGFLLVTLTWFWPRRRWLGWVALAPILIGLGYHVAGIVMRCVLRDRPPVSTLYETALFIAGTGVIAGLVVEALTRVRIGLSVAPVIGALGLLIANRYEVLKGEDTMPQLVAVLDTNFWLTVHVLCITVGYMGGLLASGFAHVAVLGRVFGLKNPAIHRSLATMVYGTLGFALIFSVVGTILGGIWANDSWGRFWGWDPKENGALMIVISQIAILHGRLGGILKPFGIAQMTILQGVIVGFSWWGVNLLGIGLHSYGHTSGVAHALAIFYRIEFGVLLLGFGWWLLQRRRLARAAA